MMAAALAAARAILLEAPAGAPAEAACFCALSLDARLAENLESPERGKRGQNLSFTPPIKLRGAPAMIAAPVELARSAAGVCCAVPATSVFASAFAPAT